MTKRDVLLGGLLLFTVGCGDRSVGERSDALVGDWFECWDTACKQLDDDGMRFKDDGTFLALDAPGSTLDPGEQYCVEDSMGISGTYTWDGATLVLQTVGSSPALAVGLTVSGDRATYTTQGGAKPQSGTLLRIDPPRSSGMCP